MYACVHVVTPDPAGDEDERLLVCAQAFAPHHEKLAAHTVVFPVRGLARLYPSQKAIAAAVQAKAEELGLAAQIGLAANPLAAVQAALSRAGTTVVPPGEEALYMAPLSLEAGRVPPSVREILQSWGIRTLGELAALPDSGVVARFGDEGRELRRRALGLASRPFVPEKPPLVFAYTMTLEEPLTLLEPLLFLLGRSLDVLLAELRQQSLATDELQLNLRLENRAEYLRHYRIPVPTRDKAAWLKKMQLDLAAHTPESPVVAYTLLAQPVAPRTWQRDLFAPPAPEPEKLELTLSRLTALLGPDRVGTPVLADTHRPDAWTLAPFRPPKGTPPARQSQAVLAIRRFRPPWPAEVWVGERSRPVHLEAAQISGKVLSAAGPFPIAGEWWTETPWEREDWDVELPNQVIYRVFHDLTFAAWFVEGYYD